MQAVAVLPGAVWAVPAAQGLQTLLLVKVGAVDWNFPGAQVDAVLQLFWPVPFWYMPGAQAVQGAPAVAEYVPAAQAEVSQDVAPVKAPAQAGQAVVPVPLWYVPAGQDVQAVAVLPGAFWAVPAAQS